MGRTGETLAVVAVAGAAFLTVNESQQPPSPAEATYVNNQIYNCAQDFPDASQIEKVSILPEKCTDLTNRFDREKGTNYYVLPKAADFVAEQQINQNYVNLRKFGAKVEGVAAAVGVLALGELIVIKRRRQPSLRTS